MSLMNAPHHEMQRVRCAGHVENPCDDRQDADDRQDDGQRPPAGRRGCGMHVIHLLLCQMSRGRLRWWARDGARRAWGAAGWLAPVAAGPAARPPVATSPRASGPAAVLAARRAACSAVTAASAATRAVSALV